MILFKEEFFFVRNIFTGKGPELTDFFQPLLLAIIMLVFKFVKHQYSMHIRKKKKDENATCIAVNTYLSFGTHFPRRHILQLIDDLSLNHHRFCLPQII